MATEYGIFIDEGCVESGFYSREEAEAAVVDRYDGEEVWIDAICHEHPEQPADKCEECHAEDVEE